MIIYKPEELDSIEFELRNGKAAIIDTDTVMGIVSLEAKNIYKIKKRPHSKKLIFFINNTERNEIFTTKEILVLNKYWPGKLTVIKNGNSYRIPKDKTILNILDRVGFLYSSSANISGQNPVKSIDEIKSMFSNKAREFVVVDNIREHTNNLPSTIINLDKNKVVRQGELDGEKILKEINNDK